MPSTPSGATSSSPSRARSPCRRSRRRRIAAPCRSHSRSPTPTTPTLRSRRWAASAARRAPCIAPTRRACGSSRRVTSATGSTSYWRRSTCATASWTRRDHWLGGALRFRPAGRTSPVASRAATSRVGGRGRARSRPAVSPRPSRPPRPGFGDAPRYQARVDGPRAIPAAWSPTGQPFVVDGPLLLDNVTATSFDAIVLLPQGALAGGADLNPPAVLTPGFLIGVGWQVVWIGVEGKLVSEPTYRYLGLSPGSWPGCVASGLIAGADHALRLAPLQGDPVALGGRRGRARRGRRYRHRARRHDLRRRSRAEPHCRDRMRWLAARFGCLRGRVALGQLDGPQAVLVGPREHWPLPTLATGASSSPTAQPARSRASWPASMRRWTSRSMAWAGCMSPIATHRRLRDSTSTGCETKASQSPSRRRAPLQSSLRRPASACSSSTAVPIRRCASSHSTACRTRTRRGAGARCRGQHRPGHE